MVLLDCHVHFYPCFDFGRLLDHAWANFSLAAANLQTAQFQAVMCMVETSNCHYFAEFSQQRAKIGAWSLHRLADPEAIELRHPQGRRMILLAGSQIATEEKLELLVLGQKQKFPDHEPLTRSLEQVFASGGLAVVPWAVGKWLGQRGKIVETILTQSPCIAADNGGRPWCWPEPKIFKNVRQLRRKILRGTDPLPLRGEERVVGGFGNYFQGELDERCITRSLLDVLRDPKAIIYSYGKLHSVSGFIRNQWRLRQQKVKVPA